MHQSRNELLTAHYSSWARTWGRALWRSPVQPGFFTFNLFINKQEPSRSKVPFRGGGFVWTPFRETESDWMAQGRNVLRVNKFVNIQFLEKLPQLVDRTLASKHNYLLFLFFVKVDDQFFAIDSHPELRARE